MKKALIFDGKIVDVADNEFEVHSSMVWVDCPDECRALDWTYADGEFTPPKPVSYVALRLMEYPPIGDQLDALWKGGDAAAEMLAKIQAVKDKYPKG